MAAAVAVEDLLAREADLDRAAGAARELGDDDLVAEGIGLPAEAAAVRRGDDADVRGGHREHLRERAVQVVRRLRAGPDRELAVGGPLRERRVLLHREVRVPLVEEEIVGDVVGGGHRVVHAAEVERHRLVDVAVVGVGVDLRRADGDRVLHALDGAGGDRTRPR